MTQFGIKVGKPGKSALSQNILDRVLDNEFPQLKTFKQGSASVNVTGAGDWTVTVTHGLGYAPIHMVFLALDPANPTQKYNFRNGAVGAPGELDGDFYVNSEILKMGWRDTSVAPGAYQTYPYKVTFYYYIFYDKI